MHHLTTCFLSILPLLCSCISFLPTSRFIRYVYYSVSLVLTYSFATWPGDHDWHPLVTKVWLHISVSTGNLLVSSASEPPLSETTDVARGRSAPRTDSAFHVSAPPHPRTPQFSSAFKEISASFSSSSSRSQWEGWSRPRLPSPHVDTRQSSLWLIPGSPPVVWVFRCQHREYVSWENLDLYHNIQDLLLNSCYVWPWPKYLIPRKGFELRVLLSAYSSSPKYDHRG